MTIARRDNGRGTWTVIVLCLLTALFEGLDIQSMGVTSKALAADLNFGLPAMGVLMSGSTFGLLIGAAVGGWASDRFGRRPVLALSMASFGLFSLATAMADGFYAMLAARLLTGLGLGGAFPNMIALTSEAVPGRWRTTALGLVYCGLPIGGIVAASVVMLARPGHWQLVFIVGGIGPLLLAPFLQWLLPNPRPQASSPRVPTRELWAKQRRRTTILLWIAYFFTLFAIYLLLNWLPFLMTTLDLAGSAPATGAIVLNVGAIIGSIVLGRLADRVRPAPILVATYSGMIASLIALAFANGIFLWAVVFFAGFFVIGGQLILYATAPALYPAAIRGRGIGAAVAVGRAGSVIGPLAAGVVLGHRPGAGAVVALTLPGLLMALLAILGVVRARASRKVDSEQGRSPDDL